MEATAQKVEAFLCGDVGRQAFDSARFPINCRKPTPVAIIVRTLAYAPIRRLPIFCKLAAAPFGLPYAELSWGALRTMVAASVSTQQSRIFRGKTNHVLARISVHET
jgi:hypothetical protein